MPARQGGHIPKPYNERRRIHEERLAPTHFLVVPKAHICCANDIDESNEAVVAHCFTVIAKLCKELGCESYRIVNNCGDQAGQTVKHLHFHVLSGRDMTWPPG